MAYYDDLTFIGGADVANCQHPPINNRFPQFYSIQYDREGTIFFAKDHGEKVILQAPVVYILHPDHHYNYGFVDGSCWHHGWLGFIGNRAQRIIEQGFMPLAPLGFTKVQDPVSFGECFDSLISHKNSHDALRHQLAVVELERMLGILIESQHHHKPDNPYSETINGIVKKLQNDPLVEWDFAKIAKYDGLSYSHFRKLFKKFTGQAPYDFLLQTRMHHAAKYMRYKNISVKELAAIYGFPDQASFSKLFKKKIGLSPRHYKETLILP